MKIILLLLLTNTVFANIEYGAIIRASELNQKFAELNTELGINFKIFEKGELISKDDIESEFYKLPIFPLKNELDSVFSSTISSNLFNNVFSKIQNDLLPILINYDSNCDCYKNVPYVIDDNISWTIDGTQNTGIGYRTMDIYLPTVDSNNKAIMYTHPMGDTAEIDSVFDISIKDLLRSKGYVFISIEYRHPILEKDQINLSTDQFDIIYALRKIRLKHSELGISPDEISSISYSKGSLALANILDTNIVLTDHIGRLSFEKMYLLDAQVTYNYDTYFDNFIDKSDICIYILGSCVSTISAEEGFEAVNNSAGDSYGMKLTKDLNVIDALRNSTNDIVFPSLRFGYNSLRQGLISPADLTTSIIPLVLDPVKIDYFLHNPESYSLFCNSYNGSCSGIDFLDYSLPSIMNDINNFFN